MESYGAIVDAARAGGRAIPELWPLGTEALAMAMEVSVLEAKRHHQRQDQHSGQRPGAGSGDDLARIRRIIAALLRKAAATSFPHDATAWREKAETLRVKYGL